jgi:hypothetical protein
VALVPCRECGKNVSTSADVCPHCGVKRPGKKGEDIAMGIGIAVLLLVFGYLIYTGKLGKQAMQGEGMLVASIAATH